MMRAAAAAAEAESRKQSALQGVQSSPLTSAPRAAPLTRGPRRPHRFYNPRPTPSPLPPSHIPNASSRVEAADGGGGVRWLVFVGSWRERTLARQRGRMPERDITSWNVMILTLANHGRVRESVELFDRMARAEKFVPNAITFVAVLSACNHGGMVEEGRRYFQMMVSEYGIRPRIEHYGCMVDILARAGFIEEALDVVSGMNCRPDAIIWRSLLDACCKQNAGLELSEAMAKLALDVPDDAVSGVYVLLSQVYASAQRWNDVGMVRRLMREEGLKKEPGFSSIEMDGLVHQFVAGDTSHPLTEEIYKKLDEIEQRLTSSGYKPNLSAAPMVAGIDHAKGAALRLHSERLAISFGLLKATDGAPIRILKNLRVCKDCHTISKIISELYGVEIIVRDRIRFHHFKDGACSCKDYW